MISNATVYALPGCGHCKNLIDKLKTTSIPHSVVYCEEDSIECDEVEDFINSGNYPIVMVDLENNNKRIYLNVKPSLAHKIVNLPDNHTLELHFTVDEIFSRLLAVQKTSL